LNSSNFPSAFDNPTEATYSLIIKKFFENEMQEKSYSNLPLPAYSPTLIKKEIKIFLIYMEIQTGAVAKSWVTVSTFMTKFLRISSYTRKHSHFLIHDFATAPI
jgi:hypothetical protein